MAEAGPARAARPRPEAWLLALAILGAGFAVDGAAFDAFDAPKRLLALFGIGVATLILLWSPARWPAQPATRAARASLALGLLGGVGIAFAAAFADEPASAARAAVALLLYALVPVLGASFVAGDGAMRTLLLAAAVAVGGNAALSLLQAAGLALPLELARLGGRYPTGALLGNEGYVALACAFLLPALMGLGLARRERAIRVACVALSVLTLAAIAVNRQLTAALAAGAGLATVAMLRAGWLRTLRAGLLGLAVLALLALLPPLRAVTLAPLLDSRLEQVQQATTYRLGAWAAADGMWRERPWTGSGPGAFADQSQSHRLAAELRLRQRLEPPPNATHFVQAHNDYLQLAAEAGLPTLLAWVAAFALVLLALARRGVRDPEAAALGGVLVAGAVAALAWFPFQVPLLALILLLALGRAWRIVATPEPAA